MNSLIEQDPLLNREFAGMDVLVLEGLEEGYAARSHPVTTVAIGLPEVAAPTLKTGIVEKALGASSLALDQLAPYDLPVADEHESDTAVTGADRETITEALAADLFSDGSRETPAVAETPVNAGGKETWGSKLMTAVRRSKLGKTAAVAAITAGGVLGFGGSSAKAVTFSDPVEQECADVALQKPDIIKSEVLRAGDFKGARTQYFYLSAQFVPMPEDCAGLWARGAQAKAQAFHNGHWASMARWGNVSIIADTNRGTWEELGNERNLQFPVCRARIILKTNLTDLSSDTGSPWHPHNSVANTRYILPAAIRPHTPADCHTS